MSGSHKFLAIYSWLLGIYDYDKYGYVIISLSVRTKFPEFFRHVSYYKVRQSNFIAKFVR